MPKRTFNAEQAKNKIAKLLQHSVEPYYLFRNLADASGLGVSSNIMLTYPTHPDTYQTDPETPKDTPEKLEYIARILVNEVVRRSKTPVLERALKKYED